MLGVARRVGHVEVVAAEGEPLAAAQDVQPLLRHGRELAPERVHQIAVELRGARDELLRRGHVPGAAFVHVDHAVGPAPYQRAGGSRVIEMDVGQEHGLEIVERQPAAREIRLEPGQVAGRSGVDEREARRAFEHRGGDHAGRTLEAAVGHAQLGRKHLHAGIMAWFVLPESMGATSRSPGGHAPGRRVAPYTGGGDQRAAIRALGDPVGRSPRR